METECKELCDKSGGEATSAFPTVSQERAKARKAAGYEVKKKAFDVQNHFDDCGKSLDGIGIKTFHLKDMELELPGPTDDEDEDIKEQCVPRHMYLGSEFEAEEVADLNLSTNVHRCGSVHELFHTLATAAPGDDVVEFCGGHARTPFILVRRNFKSGGN